MTQMDPGTPSQTQVLFANNAQTKLEIVSPDNPLPVTATITASVESTAEATAAAPTYSEGQDAPLSQTLEGSLRVTNTTALPAGTNNIGNVGGKTVSVTVTPTVTATNAYGTNYVVGGLLTFPNAFTATGSGIVQSVAVTCKKVETSGFTLFLFNSNPSNTTWTDAAVANINASDVAAIRGYIPLTANSQLGTCTFLNADSLGIAMAPGSTSLYGVLIANAALTNQFGSTSDITVTVKVLQDL